MALMAPMDRAMTIQDLQAAGYDTMLIIRTSTTEQKKSIEQQKEDVEQRMKQLGFKKPVFVTVENVSGAKADREQIRDVMDFIRSRPEGQRNLIVVVRDPARFSRFTLQGLLDQQELEELGCYLYISNQNLVIGGRGFEQGTARMQFEFLMTVSTYAKFDETQASIRGRKRTKKLKGIQGGTARDTFRENIVKTGKQKDKTVFRRVAESMGALEAGTASVKGLAREFSNSRRVVYPRTVRSIRDEISRVKSLVGEEGLQTWLNVWDELVSQENNRRVGRLSKPPRAGKGKQQQATRQTERARAIWRVSQGYIANPDKWNDPVNIGNRETATFPSKENTGTIEHASKNPIQYIPPAR
jgi:DNA invertase Pin-like site-specific DNA recombinase